MKIAYHCIVKEQEDGKFLLTFPDLEEAFTEGESLTEALFNAEEILTLTLDGRVEEGGSIPVPVADNPHLKSSYTIYPLPRVQAALLVRFFRLEERGLAELARSLEASWPADPPLEDPHH